MRLPHRPGTDLKAEDRPVGSKAVGVKAGESAYRLSIRRPLA